MLWCGWETKKEEQRSEKKKTTFKSWETNKEQRAKNGGKGLAFEGVPLLNLTTVRLRAWRLGGRRMTLKKKKGAGVRLE